MEKTCILLVFLAAFVLCGCNGKEPQPPRSDAPKPDTVTHNLRKALAQNMPEQWEIVSVAVSPHFFLFLSHKQATSRGFQEGVNDPSENITVCDIVQRKSDKPLTHWQGRDLVIWGGGKDWTTYRKDILAALKSTKETSNNQMQNIGTNAPNSDL